MPSHHDVPTIHGQPTATTQEAIASLAAQSSPVPVTLATPPAHSNLPLARATPAHPPKCAVWHHQCASHALSPAARPPRPSLALAPSVVPCLRCSSLHLSDANEVAQSVPDFSYRCIDFFLYCQRPLGVISCVSQTASGRTCCLYFLQQKEGKVVEVTCRALSTRVYQLIKFQRSPVPTFGLDRVIGTLRDNCKLIASRSVFRPIS